MYLADVCTVKLQPSWPARLSIPCGFDSAKFTDWYANFSGKPFGRHAL